MGEEKTFEREVLDRLIIIETTLKNLTVQCPRCQEELIFLGKAVVSLEASTKSAHHRIDGVYKTAGVISATVGLLVSFLSFLFNNIPKGGH
ncbi:hypothetical protein EV210_101140 [Anaerospora hongkongensis]|uniref:Uncharacterized protein n=1 Tax=Anaerospora hongkongensis TaxID=244830 RepID=A0A4R1Q4K3_9FIRM|nr:hypothetical protein [Anaerospora hongkongensis]TCL39942.1 hypothetical protein EV210_101140 [Anaerospora hongkongensis]